jgi:competence ComEA-like helix-hairpin-helix protein
MTTTERNALLLLFGLGAVGHGVRLLALAPEGAPGGISITSQLQPDDLAAQRARALRVGRPLAQGERIDVNQASAEEIARLPRIGMSLAKTIVRARDREGGFATIADLDRVPGIGAALLGTIAEHISLGDTARARRSKDRVTAGQAPAVFSSPPAHEAGPTIVLEGGRKRRQNQPTPIRPSGPVHLNQAGESDLVALPGIGPTRAKAIIAYRQTNGPFASVSDLEKVPGLPRRLVRQLVTQVVIP